MGRTGDIDRVIESYLTKYPIQFENAMTEIVNEKHMKPFTQTNEYAGSFREAQKLMEIIDSDGAVVSDMSTERAIAVVNEVSKQISEATAHKEMLTKEKNRLIELKNQIEPFCKLKFDIEKLLKFEFIRFRFGKMPRDSYAKFETYIDELDVFFVPGHMDAQYVWGIYFTTESLRKNIDPMFASLHFERIHISDELVGTPAQAFDNLTQKVINLDDKINKLTNNQSEQINSRKNEIVSAYTKIDKLNSNYAIRKYAAQMKGDVLDAYIIVGWITEEDSISLGLELNRDTEVVYIVEDEDSGVRSKPPTKLHNPKLFKPFEMFTRMYGMPAYDEMDPTIFVGITYAFIFGMMFGDFGQGLVLLLGGAWLYKKKNIALAAILSFAGLFSTMFGFAYGSVFGYEHVLPTLWLKPMEETTTILVVSVVFGISLIIVAMIINIINKVRQGRIGEALFDTNGVSGLVFYIAALTAAGLMLLGNVTIAGWIVAIFIGLPLLLTAFKEPIIRFMEHEKHLIKGKKGEYLMETFFEMFEVLLSYVTNTISFVRIGAFALSHAGMMSVVHMLSETTRGQNIIVLILGNLLVMGLEGLIVGIQVLRLEYYEMFSRFFTAGGKEFKPYKELKNDE